MREGGREGEAPALPRGDAVGEKGGVALGEGNCEALPQALELGLGLGVVEGQREAEAVGEVSCEGEVEALLLGDRLGSCASPAAVQADCARYGALQGMGAAAPVGQKVPAGHCVHVALVEAPMAPLEVPGGQSVGVEEEVGQKAPAGQAVALEEEEGQKAPAGQSKGVKEERGQKVPAGHITGKPEEQKKEAGHGTQVSWRSLLFPGSARYTESSGPKAIWRGVLSRAEVPQPSALPAAAAPASTCSTAPDAADSTTTWLPTAASRLPEGSRARPLAIMPQVSSRAPAALYCWRPAEYPAYTLPLGAMTSTEGPWGVAKTVTTPVAMVVFIILFWLQSEVSTKAPPGSSAM